MSTVTEEVARARERLGAVAHVDARKELVDNAYPLVAMLADSTGMALGEIAAQMAKFHERLELCENVLAEQLEQAESTLMPDLAGRIDDVLAMGLRVCTAAGDDAGNPKSDLAEQIAAYRAAVNELRAELDEVTVELEDDDDQDDDNESDDNEENA